MDRAEMNEAKARVQTVLIDPLGEDGLQLRRYKRWTVAQHEGMLADLRSRLAYLAEDELIAVREAAISTLDRNAQWPPPAYLLGLAYGIRKPPPDDSPMVRSYIRSVGQKAYDAGHLVELYLHLKSKGRPPSGDWDWRLIREEAEKGRRERRRLRARQEVGDILSTSEHDVLESYARHMERAKALLPTQARGGAA